MTDILGKTVTIKLENVLVVATKATDKGAYVCVKIEGQELWFDITHVEQE